MKWFLMKMNFRFRMSDRDATITFEEFVSYFPENEVYRRNQIMNRSLFITLIFLESETWVSSILFWTSEFLTTKSQPKYTNKSIKTFFTPINCQLLLFINEGKMSWSVSIDNDSYFYFQIENVVFHLDHLHPMIISPMIASTTV